MSTFSEQKRQVLRGIVTRRSQAAGIQEQRLCSQLSLSHALAAGRWEARSFLSFEAFKILH